MTNEELREWNEMVSEGHRIRRQLAEAREALTPELAALADKAHAWISDEDNYRAQDVFVEDLEGTSQIEMARLLSALRALGGATT